MKTAQLSLLGTFYFGSTLSLFALQAAPPSSPPNQSPVPQAESTPALTPRSHEERERNYAAEHRIILNVEVTDSSGKQVAGLKEEDFTLLDNQIPRKLLSFTSKSGKMPGARAHVLLVLDGLNNNSKAMGLERKEIEKFLEENQGRLDYPVSVGILSGAGISVGEPSQDGNVLIADLERRSGRLRPSSCADEASNGGSGNPFAGKGIPVEAQAAMQNGNGFSTQAACENSRFKLSISQLNLLATKEEDVSGRAIVIWIGPGWPQLSGPEFMPETPAMKRNSFDYRVGLTRTLREAQITLDSVSFPGSSRDAEPHDSANRALVDGVAREDQASAATMALPVLVHETGGLTLELSKDIAASISTCVADADSYYVLSFNSPAASKAGEYHALEVRVNKPGLTARTNRAYYAQP